ncbi:hypothetical protein [Bacillus paranthracis]|jgi:hypothetical protein|uniref:hypothetical protein n=1 Tax=Bacillus paranthracis TaxID=2026186 RepID=UPI0012994EA8|nr:hypothetical protein [Bacillus paranthracis]QPA42212.1 hypothetical protein INR14_29415 [Bacillus paranthracis]
MNKDKGNTNVINYVMLIEYVCQTCKFQDIQPVIIPKMKCPTCGYFVDFIELGEE